MPETPPQPDTAPSLSTGEVLSRRDIHAAMLDAWNTICEDTGCHPLDIERRGKELFFKPGHWADLVALFLDADDTSMPAGCDWPDGIFTFADEPGEHDPCYVVMPGGAMIALNHHAREGVDIARAKFIIAACNAALSQPPATEQIRREVIEECAKVAETYPERYEAANPVRRGADRMLSATIAKDIRALAATEQARSQEDGSRAAGVDLNAAIEAGAQALANDVWHTPQLLESLGRHEANKFRRQAEMVLKAAQPSPAGSADDRRTSEDMTLAWNSRKAAIEECARLAEGAKEIATKHYGIEASIGADIAMRRIRDLIAVPSTGNPDDPS